MDKSKLTEEALAAYRKKYGAGSDGNIVSGPWVEGYVAACVAREAARAEPEQTGQPNVSHQLEISPTKLQDLQAEAPAMLWPDWREELIRLTAEKTGRQPHQVKLDEAAAWDWWRDGITPYVTFRENFR